MGMIDLSQLPAPDVVETLDYEAILAERHGYFVSLYPADQQDAVRATLTLESEPITKLLQENAYRELVWRQRVNDAARSVMLAFAEGADLTHLAALFGLKRLTVSAANEETGAAAVMEEDADLRDRTQLAPQGFSVAGPRAAYISRARAVDGRVLDVNVTRPEPGDLLLSILTREGDGTADDALCAAVLAALSDETVRPMNDTVFAASAQIVRYRIAAELITFRDFDADVVLAAARKRLDAYIAATRRIGREVTRSGIYAALHVEGVERVVLLEPANDLPIGPTQALYCTGVSIKHGGIYG
ncbi:baseplate assembly protein [Ralstonia solanacearum]|nr:baseplate assembly protein [Ralstonia solanacearum]